MNEMMWEPMQFHGKVRGIRGERGKATAAGILGLPPLAVVRPPAARGGHGRSARGEPPAPWPRIANSRFRPKAARRPRDNGRLLLSIPGARRATLGPGPSTGTPPHALECKAGKCIRERLGHLSMPVASGSSCAVVEWPSSASEAVARGAW